jgi:hypothetical protein
MRRAADQDRQVSHTPTNTGSIRVALQPRLGDGQLCDMARQKHADHQTRHRPAHTLRVERKIPHHGGTRSSVIVGCQGLIGRCGAQSRRSPQSLRSSHRVHFPATAFVGAERDSAAVRPEITLVAPKDNIASPVQASGCLGDPRVAEQSRKERPMSLRIVISVVVGATLGIEGVSTDAFG